MQDGTATPADARTVLDFWFGEATPEQWFRKDDAFDATIRDRFAGLYERAAGGACDDWRHTAEGSLALIVVLDQFPRNMFRGTPQAFATDAAARAVLRHALEARFDRSLDRRRNQFLYMPLQHSEDAADQALSVRLNAALGDAEVLQYAEAHKAIIDRFGRFPHRNAVLGRETTAEEADFLTRPGSSF